MRNVRPAELPFFLERERPFPVIHRAHLHPRLTAIGSLTRHQRTPTSTPLWASKVCRGNSAASLVTLTYPNRAHVP